MALVARSFRLAVNGDGTRDTDYPAGDKPPSAATLSWADLSAVAALIASRTTGSAFSHDVRQYLSGTGAATATITIVTVSGDDAASEGWSIENSDDLEHPGTGTGSGAFKLRATVTGNSLDSDPLNWVLSAAPSADTTAPTVPTGLSYVADEGEVIVSWDASTDPYVGEAGEGVKEYDIRFDGGAPTVVAGVPGLSLPLTQTLLGASDGTPDSTQDGTDWSLSFGGAGIDDATDNVLFRGAQITGDFTLTCKVASLTSAASFPKVGLAVYETLAVGAKRVLLYFQGNGKSQGRSRTTTDATDSGNLFNNTVAAPIYLQIKRTSNSWALNVSTDGNNWVSQATPSNPMASTVFAGLFLTSGAAGTNATAEIEQFALNNAPRVSYTKATTSTVSVQVRARDLAGAPNVSAYSTALSATPLAVPSEPAKRWHPGHYLNSQPPQSVNAGTPNHATINSNANFKGAQWLFSWGVLEPTRDNYSFTRINTFKGQLAAGKKWGLWFTDRQPNGSGPASSFSSNWLPSYINAAEFSTGWAPYHLGLTAKFWLPSVMDREILLMQALAVAYDNDPTFEYIIINFESIVGQVQSSDYSDSANLAQTLRLMDAAAAAFKKTNVFASLNYLGSGSSLLLQLNQKAIEKKIGVFGPDHTASNADGTASIVEYGIFRGVTGTLGDLRGVLPRALRYGDHTVMGTGFCATTAVGQEDNNGLMDHALTHHIWTATTLAAACQNWSTGIVPAVAANPNNIYTTAPTAYTQGVDTT
jgi:hypothetical protein